MPKSIWKTFFTFTWATLFRKSNLSNNLFSLLKYKLAIFIAGLYFLLIRAGVEKIICQTIIENFIILKHLIGIY